MSSKLGVLVVGQSPRPEITAQFEALLPRVELVQRGCLDGLSRQEICDIAPKTGEQRLFTRLPDGTGVELSKEAVIEHGSAQLDALEGLAADAVIVMCTGAFPKWEDRNALFPSRILRHAVMGLRANGHVGVLTPLAGQMEDARQRWERCGFTVTGAALSPNADTDQTMAAGQVLEQARPDLLIFDCVSYTVQTKHLVCQRAGRPGVLAVTAIARAAAELLDR